ncbi:MAG: O-antigen ligase family protein [Gemmatimonadetes bacterium]|nr:O-antigen ligase family protein [Gemmatimonadota bacterium]
MSPWPSVPPKQLGTIIGAVALLCVQWNHLGPRAWDPLRRAPVLVKSAYAFAGAFLLWQALLILSGPQADRYEALWGNSSRGNGLFSRAAIIGMGLSCALFPPLQSGRSFMRAVRFSALLVGVYATMQAFGIDMVSWDVDTRYVATFGNVNQASSFFALAASMMATQVVDVDRWKNRNWAFWVDAGLAVIMIALCLRTANHTSRQGEFLLACVVLIAGLSFGYSRWRQGALAQWQESLGLAAMVLGALGASVWFVLVDHGASDRVAMWSTAVKMAIANPLHGVGVSQVPYHWQAYQTARDAMGDVFRLVDEVHSGPLQQAAESGLVGFLLYVGAFAAILPLAFVALARGRAAERAAAAGWFVYALQDNFSPYSAAVSLWGWICAGILLAGALERGVERSSSPGTGVAPFDVSRAGRGHWSGVLLIMAVATWVIMPRIVTEVQFTRLWNTASELDATAAAVRYRVATRVALAKLEPLADRRPNDYEWLERIAYASATNGDVERSARVLQAGLRRKPRAMRLRDLYAQVELTHGSAQTAMAQYDTLAEQFPRSLALGLLRQITAEWVRDSVRLRSAGSHVDSLGVMYGVSVDSMHLLHDRLGRGVVVMGRRMNWRN